MVKKEKMKPGRNIISRGRKFEEVVYISLIGKKRKSTTKHEPIKAASNTIQ